MGFIKWLVRLHVAWRVVTGGESRDRSPCSPAPVRPRPLVCADSDDDAAPPTPNERLLAACRDGTPADATITTVERIRKALQDGADPRLYEGTRQLTPLMAAARRGDAAAMLPLLESGASPNAADGRGCTAVLFASCTRSKEAVELLVRFGGRLGVADKDGNTCMHSAAAAGNLQMVSLLLTEGAPHADMNGAGKRPIDVVCTAPHAPPAQKEAIVEVLRTVGAHIDVYRSRKALAAELSTARTSFAAAEAARMSTESAITDLTRTIDSVTKAKTAVEEALKTRDSDCADLELQAKGLSERVQALERERETLTAQVHTLQRERDALAARITSATSTAALPAPSVNVPMTASVWSAALPAEPRPRAEWDRYEKVEELGRGSFGAVYKVRIRPDDGAGAVSVLSGAAGAAGGAGAVSVPLTASLLPGGPAAATADRFAVVKVATIPAGTAQGRELQEVAALLRVQRHPNTVALLDHWVEATATGRTLCIVLELAGRGDVAKHCAPERRAAMSIAQILRLLCDTAAGLAHVHAQGMLHRDMKPGNVLVADDERAMLADFGLARPADLSATAGVGSPLYQAPEVLLGRPYDRAADVWALGVMWHQVLAGCGFEPKRGNYPYQLPAEDAGKDITVQSQLIACVRDGELHSRRVSDAAGMPAHVTALLEAMLSRVPADRPSAARAHATALLALDDAVIAAAAAAATGAAKPTVA